jgi:hypothetical protein
MSKVEKSAGYASAIEVLIENHKTYALLCGAPLVALAAQLRWIQLVESIAVKLMLTVAIICLFATGAICLFFIDLMRNYLAKIMVQSEFGDDVSTPYLSFLDRIYGGSVGELSEENLTNMAARFTHPLACLAIAGWALILASLLLVMWSSPGP